MSPRCCAEGEKDVALRKPPEIFLEQQSVGPVPSCRSIRGRDLLSQKEGVFRPDMDGGGAQQGGRGAGPVTQVAAGTGGPWAHVEKSATSRAGRTW